MNWVFFSPILNTVRDLLKGKFCLGYAWSQLNHCETHNCPVLEFCWLKLEKFGFEYCQRTPSHWSIPLFSLWFCQLDIPPYPPPILNTGRKLLKGTFCLGICLKPTEPLWDTQLSNTAILLAETRKVWFRRQSENTISLRHSPLQPVVLLTGYLPHPLPLKYREKTCWKVNSAWGYRHSQSNHHEMCKCLFSIFCQRLTPCCPKAKDTNTK